MTCIISNNKPQHKYIIDLNNCSGNISINYSINLISGKAIPCKISVIYDNTIYSTGFIGDSSFNENLMSMGYSSVVDNNTSGVLTFFRDPESTIEKAKLIIDTPLLNSYANIEVNCELCEGSNGSDSTTNGSDSFGSDSFGSDNTSGCECITLWNLDDCLNYNILSSGDYVIVDGAEGAPSTPYSLTIPKNIVVTIQGTECYDADGVFEFEWNPSDSTFTGGSSGYKLIEPDPRICTQSLYGTPYGFDLAYVTVNGRDNENTPWFAQNGTDKNFFVEMQFKHIIIRAIIRMPIRYRREYGDWTFGETSETAHSQYGPFDLSRVYVFLPTIVGGSPCEPISCPSWNPSNDITVSIQATNSCRNPIGQQDCTECINSPSVDYSTLPSYPFNESSCPGRPIDIDIDACNSTIRPTSFSKPNFVLYYTGGADQPFLVIDNIAYDVRNVNGLVKVFTTDTPEEIRDMVCSRVRFADLIDANKLNTNINEALISNWPYNDLYWYSTCANLPDETPINLVPC